LVAPFASKDHLLCTKIYSFAKNEKIGQPAKNEGKINVDFLGQQTKMKTNGSHKDLLTVTEAARIDLWEAAKQLHTDGALGEGTNDDL
jgi:hypothetical protein